MTLQFLFETKFINLKVEFIYQAKSDFSSKAFRK